MIKLVFELPPSLNRLYKCGGGHMYMTSQGKNYKDGVAWGALAQYREQEIDDPVSGALAVTYRFYGTQADEDNLKKVLCDGLNGVAWVDDKNIVESHTYIDRKPTKNRRVEIEIRPL